MLINKEQAGWAGEDSNKVCGWTDDELKRSIKFQGLALAFLEGKGPKWSLATSPLRQELDRLKDMARSRGFGDIVACW